jgi:hypothetical protein
VVGTVEDGDKGWSVEQRSFKTGRYLGPEGESVRESRMINMLIWGAANHRILRKWRILTFIYLMMRITPDKLRYDDVIIVDDVGLYPDNEEVIFT